MNVKRLHSWEVPIEEARALQCELALKVEPKPLHGEVHTVAGVDVGFKGVGLAAVVVLSYPALKVIEVAKAERPVSFPYVPGLLSFREGPVVLEAIEKLQTVPDLFMFDGQGRAHPRRLGIASHIGLMLDKPSIGCAKSRLIGTHGELANERGATSELVDKGEVIGMVVRTRAGVNPVFVSIGDKIDLSTAVRYVLDTSRGYRLPEPLRLAHRLASGNA